MKETSYECKDFFCDNNGKVLLGTSSKYEGDKRIVEYEYVECEICKKENPKFLSNS